MLSNATRAAFLKIIKGLDLYADLRAKKTECGIAHEDY